MVYNFVEGRKEQRGRQLPDRWTLRILFVLIQ
jgi:hypothetical protein